jgi:hypothetical protein
VHQAASLLASTLGIPVNTFEALIKTLGSQVAPHAFGQQQQQQQQSEECNNRSKSRSGSPQPAVAGSSSRNSSRRAKSPEPAAPIAAATKGSLAKPAAAAAAAASRGRTAAGAHSLRQKARATIAPSARNNTAKARDLSPETPPITRARAAGATSSPGATSAGGSSSSSTGGAAAASRNKSPVRGVAASAGRTKPSSDRTSSSRQASTKPGRSSSRRASPNPSPNPSPGRTRGGDSSSSRQPSPNPPTRGPTPPGFHSYRRSARQGHGLEPQDPRSSSGGHAACAQFSDRGAFAFAAPTKQSSQRAIAGARTRRRVAEMWSGGVSGSNSSSMRVSSAAGLRAESSRSTAGGSFGGTMVVTPLPKFPQAGSPEPRPWERSLR